MAYSTSISSVPLSPFLPYGLFRGSNHFLLLGLRADKWTILAVLGLRVSYHWIHPPRTRTAFPPLWSFPRLNYFSHCFSPAGFASSSRRCPRETSINCAW